MKRVDSRQYPERPIVGVGAVIVDAGKVVLVRRRYEPLAGQWSLPGGTLELGETHALLVVQHSFLSQAIFPTNTDILTPFLAAL